ncbi:MAG: monovalent cation/H(+) antiporter subunit G [Chitinophagaceae bacterium]|nr:MAG: monovalent cation/H(+) antiporter subunit G [Chitinophagaceae bacterium]
MIVVAEILILLLVLIGVGFISIAGLGILTMPDTYTRMSVVTKAVTMGVGAIMTAVVIHFNDTIIMLKVFGLILFLLFSLSVAAHVIGLTAYRDGAKLWNQTFHDDFDNDMKKIKSIERDKEKEIERQKEIEKEKNK